MSAKPVPVSIDRPQRIEDRLGIKTTPLGSIRQDDKDWPIRCAIVEVTPTLAALFLSYRVGSRQRTVKLMHYAALARDMAADRFLFTGQPLIFSEGGNLDDGQHRCRACVATGKNFVCLVLFGVPDSSYIAMDVTAKRTSADALRANDIPQAPEKSAAAKLIFQWEAEDLVTPVSLTPIQTNEVVANNPGLCESIIRAKGLGKLFHGQSIPNFCHYLVSRVDRDAADEFFGKLGTDVGHQEKSPVLALRRFLQNKDRLPTRQKIGAFIRAWNHWRKGEKVVSIRFSADDPMPKPI